jgi:pimeloyl-ACP methyl ester carboxylesterase
MKYRQGKIMKQKLLLSCAILAAFLGATGQAQHFPNVLNDEMSQTALGPDTRKVTILIHGWQPCGGSGNAYASGSFYNLSQGLKSSFLGTAWQLVLYRWEQDADTAYSLLCNGVLNLGVLDAASATAAANNALLHGGNIAQLLNQQAPNLRQVHIIAHSAGTWAAYRAALNLLQANPFVTIQITLLDGYVPGTGSLTTTAIENLANGQGSDRIFRLENYHGTFLVGDLADILGPACDHTFSNWRSSIDINLIVSFYSLMNGVNFWCYHGHSGPIDYYSDSVLAALPLGQGGQVSGCLSGAPYFLTDNGFYKSLFYERYFLPVIASNPQSQSAHSGASALLQVAASSSQALSYQWFLNGQPISGATSASYSCSAAR